MEFAPHGYYEVEAFACYVKVMFFHVAGNGFAAITGLRVFGHADKELPEAVANLTVVCGPRDLRNATLTWTRSDRADGYIVRYGIAPDKLYNQYQIYSESVEVHTLTIDIRYFFRAGSFNAGGIPTGATVIGSI